MYSHSIVSNSATPWTVAHQASLSMGSSRQEYWSGLPFPFIWEQIRSFTNAQGSAQCITETKFQNSLYYEVHEKVPVNISQMSSELTSPGTSKEKAELMPFRDEMCLETS